VPSVGGGICQVATTLFQPVFWAGYQLDERRTHSYWIPAYASRGLPGLDVTVDADANMDFRWTNTTGDYVLIQSSIEGETVNFALYGRKPTWQVAVSEPEITNARPSDPTPVREDEPGMPSGRSLQVSTARDGFDVQLTRIVRPNDGGDPRTLRVRTSYQPSRAVTLVGVG
jgi:vancomycin resistance protein YoaR